MLLSVIIINWNYGEYLRNCLESVAAQTFREWECIVIDDGSTDDSCKIIREFCARDPRFRLIKFPESRGIASARNAGLDAVRGDYIFFLDSDDYLAEYAFELLFHLTKQTDADMICPWKNFITKDFRFVAGNISWCINPFSTICRIEGYFQRNSGGHRFLSATGKLFRRGLIGKTRFNPKFPKLGGGTAFMLDIAHRAKIILESSNVIYFKRNHVYQLSNINAWESYIFDFIPDLLDHISGHGLHEKYTDWFWREFYQELAAYLFSNTFMNYNGRGMADKTRPVLIAACKRLPLRFLPLRVRILVWYLR